MNPPKLSLKKKMIPKSNNFSIQNNSTMEKSPSTQVNIPNGNLMSSEQPSQKWSPLPQMNETPQSQKKKIISPLNIKEGWKLDYTLLSAYTFVFPLLWIVKSFYYVSVFAMKITMMSGKLFMQFGEAQMKKGTKKSKDPFAKMDNSMKEYDKKMKIGKKGSVPQSLVLILCVLSILIYSIPLVDALTVEKELPEDSTGVAGTMDILKSFWTFIATYWWALILAGLVLGAGALALFLVKRMEDERTERDDPVYEGYKNVIKGSIENCDCSKIHKTWSIANIFLLGLPLFKKEHSSRILNWKGDLIGYYRGHCYTMDNCINFLYYKTKSFIFMENKLLMKCPLKSYITLPLYDNEKGRYAMDKSGKPLSEEHLVDTSGYITYLNNGDIKIHCEGTQRVSYFRYPTYLNKDGSIVDIRESINDRLVGLKTEVQFGRILAQGSKQVEDAMKYNPGLRYVQMSPEKTRTERDDFPS